MRVDRLVRRSSAKKDGELHVVSFKEAVKRFDFVHRPNPARRAAGNVS